MIQHLTFNKMCCFNHISKKLVRLVIDKANMFSCRHLPKIYNFEDHNVEGTHQCRKRKTSGTSMCPIASLLVVSSPAKVVQHKTSIPTSPSQTSCTSKFHYTFGLTRS